MFFHQNSMAIPFARKWVAKFTPTLKRFTARRIGCPILFIYIILCELISPDCSNFFYSSNAFAEERVVTLNEAIMLGLREHEVIKAAKESLYQSEQFRKKAISNILPHLTAEGTYTKYLEEKVREFDTIKSVIQPDYTYGYNVRLGVPVYQGGKEWSALRQAKYLLKSGEEGLAHTSEGVIMEVASAYYTVLKVGRELEIKDADLKRAVERRRVAQARFDVGEVTKALVLRAEAEVAGIEADVRRIKKDLDVSQERLSRLVGIPVGFKVEEPPEIALPVTDQGINGIDSLIETALSGRSDYLKAKADEEIAKEGIRYARGGFMPTLRLEGIYSWRDQDPITSLFFNKESIFATLTLSFPLYEGGLRVAEVKEAESKYREAELMRLILKKDIELQVREAYHSIDAFKSTREFFQKQVSFAEENYNTVFKQFTYGLATNVDVIDANSVLVAAQESFANSKFDLQLAILELKRRMGILTEEMTVE